MIGTVTKVESSISVTKKITFDITSNSTGAAESDELKNVHGTLYRIDVFPAATPDIPTDLFDIHLWDTNLSATTYGSLDLLASAGEDLTNSVPTMITPTSPPLIAGDCTLRIDGMGNANKVYIAMYIE